jgi:hypothetical protein
LGRIIENTLSPALGVPISRFTLTAGGKDVIEGVTVGIDEFTVTVKVEVVSWLAAETVGSEE